ncbi:type VI secretion system amidase effector protein Tae4 [Pseudomonas granadensis]|uniref:type VI secretion system amidase effector protein Tae4 n=1 Tax=Pseudomonas granadensis TaxID=1421430 RepID=UPI0008798295|nr:type VI secretion system amidase effector protein Tae4 [Pseudomonas granadensis]SDS16136.1 Type VI secretion system (T6SS), amidase effector protein 4 [Pseudomonas granadensis]
MAQLNISAGGVTSNILVKRPKFSTLWTAYAEVGPKSSIEVYALVGGNVEAARAEKPDAYANACALRISRGFNYGGYKIPKGTIIPSKSIYRLAGADQLPYIMKVADFLAFLKHNWGAPDRELKMSESDYINGKKGVIIMEINGWSDATGHATLWNGSATGDNSDYHRPDSHTYDRPDVKLEKINFWELKG